MYRLGPFHLSNDGRRPSESSMVICTKFSPFHDSVRTILPCLGPSSCQDWHCWPICPNKPKPTWLNCSVDEHGKPWEKSKLQPPKNELCIAHHPPWSSAVFEWSILYQPWEVTSSHQVAFFSSLVMITCWTEIPLRSRISFLTSSTLRAITNMGAKQSLRAIPVHQVAKSPWRMWMAIH